MEIILNGKKYVAGTVQTRMFRQAISINEKIDFNNLKAKDLDELIDFICLLYGNVFDRDTFYDGLPADKLMSTLSECISGTVSGITKKAESKNE